MNIFEHLTVTNIDMALYSTLSRGDKITMHNRKWYGITFAEDGRNIYTQNGIRYVSDTQHALFLPLGSNYELFCRENGHFPVINFQCSENLNFNTIKSFKVPGSLYFVSRCEKLRKLLVIGNATSRVKSFSVLYDIISQLAQIHELSTHSPLLSPAVAYLEKHFTDSDISNRLLAEKAGISEVYFRKLFLETYGLTAGQYIINLRINYAKKLLAAGEKVSETAFLSGYSNPYHFSRIFKQKTGMNPNAYKHNTKIIGL